MPRPRTLTLAEAQKIAHAKDPGLWGSLTPKQRREVVAEFNAQQAKAWAAHDLIGRVLEPRRRRKAR